MTVPSIQSTTPVAQILSPSRILQERDQETRETGRYLAECGTCLLIGRDVTVAIASSGIAATLLDGGRTAHSALKLPLNIVAPGCGLADSSAWILSCAGSCILPERVSTILQIYKRE
ncbi:hypothetical protein LAZ67_1003540 [Cordylochernes scorpioides]|uniref:ATP-dependent DNA helicase n=1 Tax=Cordylochernes scorpioides TaxID=51811 RepID=A0ABY6JYD3_9ARAC|nr:hypothetical protein LAZ67_1003540 [Cordylochernes scorpioides]